MIVTCPKCHTEYKLDPQKLGSAGRAVRCTDCYHTWTQTHVQEKDIADVMADTIDFVDSAQLMIEVASRKGSPREKPTDSFEDILQQTAAAMPPAPKMPDVLKPKPLDSSIPAPITYKVMGMGPGQFGMLTFLLCLFISSSALFLSKDFLVQSWPAFAGLYRTLGFEVRAPGEGLRFSDINAENRIKGTDRVLAVEGKIANISDRKMPYPALRVTLKSAYGAALKSWTIDARDKPPLASGDSAAVKSEFNDAPEGGESVEMKVVQP